MTRATKLAIGFTFIGQLVFAQATTQAVEPVDVPVRKQPTLSPAQMSEQSRDYLNRIKLAEGRIKGLADAARKQKDVIKLNCLSDKLAEVGAIVTTATKSRQALQQEAARGNKEGSDAALHEFTKITILNQKVQFILAEAIACVGEDLRYVGTTAVDVEYEGTPPPDYTQPTVLRPGVARVPRPPFASPYK